MDINFEALINVQEVLDLLDPTALLYLIGGVVILFIGKLVNDALTPYRLDQQLTEVDNKAVAVSFAGYIFSIGIIIAGVLQSESAIEATGHFQRDILLDLGNTMLWGAIGILLLQVARIVNDKLIFREFCNIKELVEDKNIGTGLVQCGSYIGSAFLIKGVLSGEDESGILSAVILMLIYFILAQITFILFAKLYQLATQYDLHKEIEQDNVAAGLAFGMNLIAIGLLLSGYLVKSDSLLGLFVWFGVGAILLLVSRFVVDRLILPGNELDSEISQDRNWGAALIEGCLALSIVLILNTIF